MTDLRSLTLKQLRALAETVRCGTVTAAAKALHVTPPAISTQLKLLEKLVGAPLFDRSVDGFRATDIGREMVEASRDIEQRIARAGERVQALNSGAAGSVVLGVVSTGKYLAPAIVAAYREANPQIRVTLSIGNRRDIILGLEHDEFDLVIMGRPPGHIALESTVLSDHPHVLVAAPGHRLVGSEKILVNDILDEQFLAREQGSGTRLLMERFLDRFADGRTFDVIEMGTNETIKQAVMAGLGIAIISAHTCYAELKDGRLATLSVPGLPVVRQWYLIHLATRPPTTAVSSLKCYILENRQNLIPGLDEFMI